jgi:hypothetical protein
MKIRNGFVSNSSSSSFVIPKSALSPDQIYKIKNYFEVVTKILEDEAKLSNGGIVIEYPDRYEYLDSGWEITETDHLIEGITSMNNFDFELFLEEIGVPMGEVSWDD